ncbi:hypothetical protein [Methanobrevibacter sp. DSM 116169]|uniref:hypothetical protein n=1 Tax=Methanobrevibacter sp. DSM 116169 TaxID=3242727 RepID=UPI0038FC5037
MEKKKFAILILIVIIIGGALAGSSYYLLTNNNKIQTIDTPEFTFNAPANEDWHVLNDHEDGYSYTNDNQTYVRYYSFSIDEAHPEYLWEDITVQTSNNTYTVYLSHFDDENAVKNSSFQYYSVFLELENDSYVHISSMDLNTTIDITESIKEV